MLTHVGTSSIHIGSEYLIHYDCNQLITVIICADYVVQQRRYCDHFVALCVCGRLGV